LSDPEKRQVYDLEGQEGLERHEKGGGMQAQNPFDMFFGGGGGGGRRKGQDAQVEIEVTLEELYNGGSRQARISRNVICPKCRGTGAKDGEQQRCHACGGKGVRMVQQQMAPGFVVQMQETCGECGGKGQIYKSKCPNCQGKKVVPDEKTLTAQIERGMPSNGQIVFERESEQSPGVTPGDVIFKFKQTPHKLFKRDGDDLHYELHISLREALLGYSRVIKHLDGRDVKIEAKGVTQPFQVRKMSGEGMPQHNTPSQMGVLHVKNIVDLPSTLSQEQKDAIAKVFT
jgi:DnaJ-class molecular chaperone